MMECVKCGTLCDITANGYCGICWEEKHCVKICPHCGCDIKVAKEMMPDWKTCKEVKDAKKC